MHIPHPERMARWGWGLLIWGAPWSHAAMSVGTGLVTVCSLWAWCRKPTRPAADSPALWLAALLAWQGFSLLWTDHVEWGVKLLSIQLSAALLAWSWTMVPLGRDQARQWVLGSAATALTILLGWGAWQQLQGEALEGRDWTPWMSHIRLAMFAALGVVWGSRGLPRAWVWAFLGLWGAFTAVTGSFTSALLWPLSLLWLMAQGASPQTRRTLTGAAVAFGIAGLGVAAWWLQPIPVDKASLPTHTALGHPYTHHPERTVSEGGHRIHLFLCETEWADAWAQVSDMALDAPNSKGFSVRQRLPRYMTSMGLPKDAEHILQLSPQDVLAIEQGATHVHPASGLALRMREFKREWEVWRDGGSASGHAVFQRFAHWRAGIWAWSQTWVFGHGVGDTPEAMATAYDSLESTLSPQHRHRAHMQHLTWGISGGLVAVVLWLGFGWTWWRRIGTISSEALWGGVVVGLCCLFEDTLETQAGVVVAMLALFGLASPVSRP